MRSITRKVAALAAAAGLVVGAAGIAGADELKGEADADAIATPHPEDVSFSQAEGTTVAYDFTAWIKETGNANDDVFPGTVSATITRGGDWLNASDGGAPAAFSFTAYGNDAAKDGTIRVTVPACTTAGTQKVITVGVAAGVSSNGKSLGASVLAFTYTITATAGSSTCSVTDTTPPVITPTVTGTKGSNDWYISDVNVSWSVSDAQSTVSSTTGCDTFNVTADQAEQTYTCEATSSGGTSSSSVTIKRDATKPASTVFGVVTDAVYATAPTVTCSATDDTSGVFDDGDPTGDTTGAGAKSVTCNGAVDNAGNTQTEASSAVAYTVAPIGGFNSNFDGGAVLVVKPNQAIPLKWAFSDSTINHALLSTATLSSVSSTRCANATGSEGSESASEVAAGASGLQLLVDNSYQMNWKATSTLGCRLLTVTMTFRGAQNGTATRSILVNIKK